jgi:hypothetical protein
MTPVAVVIAPKGSISQIRGSAASVACAFDYRRSPMLLSLLYFRFDVCSEPVEGVDPRASDGRRQGLLGEPADSEVAIDRGVGDRLEPARKVPVIGVRMIRTSIRLFYVWAPDFLDSFAARAARPAVVGDDRDVYHRPVPMWRRDTPGHGRALRAE